MKWAYAYLLLLLLTALGADFLARERPLLSYRDTQYIVTAPIPFDAAATDLMGLRYAPPLTLNRNGHRHWLGTDRLGRDTAAGLIAGARVAVFVGAGSVLLALLIGLPLGAVAGFFGNDGLRVSRGGYWAALLGLVLGSCYTYACLRPFAGGGVGGHLLVLWLLTVGASSCLLHLVLRILGRRFSGLRKPVALPLDHLVLFFVEWWTSVPGLVVLVVLLALIRTPTLWMIVAIIGTLGWPAIARFVRADLLRIRDLTYIDAARISGVGGWRLLVQHALPNTFGPLAVVASFLVGSSILAEASLSFLGLGLPADQISWGSMLQQSRIRPGAWWLAVFPGLLLTLTVLACNRLRA